jgi:hypothetical protein
VAAYLLDQQPGVLRQLPLPAFLQSWQKPGDMKEQLALQGWRVEEGEW